MSTVNTLPPSLFEDGDTPRVHAGDPITSHQAADKSQRAVTSVRTHVLTILGMYGPLAAFEVCDMYQIMRPRLAWPKASHETPRKRISDMKAEGLLVETGDVRLNREGSPEVVVKIATVSK